jgi:hypothetical protein
MGWPKDRPRPRKVSDESIGKPEPIFEDEPEIVEREPNQPPADWQKGALLNVRNYGDAYVVTLHGEEYSIDRPERALRFTNPALCQDFVSAWYSREHCDPRAR